MIKLDKMHETLEEVKIIGFGSSFKYNEEMSMSAATPEYLPLEVLEYLGAIRKNPDNKESLA